MMVGIQENTICFIDEERIFIVGHKRCHIYFKVWHSGKVFLVKRADSKIIEGILALNSL